MNGKDPGIAEDMTAEAYLAEACRKLCHTWDMDDESYDIYAEENCEYCPVVMMREYFEVQTAELRYRLKAAEMKLREIKRTGGETNGQAGEDLPGRDDGREIPAGSAE